ncbi:hypothetical protein K457DRAFT_33429 [Linnemannia elongata AG-77]|uniref:Uncharacterized protein n=1 Tax=Linnemannia elongata AG-77 TaxID=1314771 RepID=A0A197JTE7_9FUNG|nr:hypothetical protein K457DRAFT_33429 [Linnemannia elongata AG-77]
MAAPIPDVGATVGGSATNFSNSAASGSNVAGGFVTHGVTGNIYQNTQVSTGGSTTSTSANNAASYNRGSSCLRAQQVLVTTLPDLFGSFWEDVIRSEV